MAQTREYVQMEQYVLSLDCCLAYKTYMKKLLVLATIDIAEKLLGGINQQLDNYNRNYCYTNRSSIILFQLDFSTIKSLYWSLDTIIPSTISANSTTYLKYKKHGNYGNIE